MFIQLNKLWNNTTWSKKIYFSYKNHNQNLISFNLKLINFYLWLLVCFRREIAALTSENHSLERQLLNFQKPISPANNTISPNLAGRINIGQRSSSDAYLHDSLRSFASNQSSHQSQSLTHQSMISPHYHHHHHHHQPNHRSVYDRTNDQHLFFGEGQSLSESEYT